MQHETKIRDAVLWFEAYGENIDETPTAKQWARIAEKMAELAELMRDCPEMAQALVKTASVTSVPFVAPTAEPEMPPADSIVLPQVMTEGLWRTSYRQRMRELGIDDEADLKDITKLAVFNAQIDPRKQATHDFNQLFKGANAA